MNNEFLDKNQMKSLLNLCIDFIYNNVDEPSQNILSLKSMLSLKIENLIKLLSNDKTLTTDINTYISNSNYCEDYKEYLYSLIKYN